MSITRRIVRNALLGSAFLMATGFGALSTATSAPNFDGLWSVVIVTQKGTCDRAYRYPIRIANGVVLNEGSSIAFISGRVSPNGVVTVTVTSGDKSATGSGRLSGTVGSGSWRGGECSGTWEAERRGV
jgi:hypothetical protein